MFKRSAARVQRVWCFCDGSTGALFEQRGGGMPLSCSAAAVARSEDGTVLDLMWEALSPVTNNEAEYAGLLLGLTLARRLQAREVICVLDSEVVVGQMQGRFAVNSPALRRWHWKACQEARGIPMVQYQLAPREWNRLADGLAAQAGMDWNMLLNALGRRAAIPSEGR